VVVFDHGQPRNQAAHRVNSYLLAESVSPAELRAIGRRQASAFGTEFIDAEVTDIQPSDSECSRFILRTASTEPALVRKLLLATGVRDRLPEIENLQQFYGSSVHHCPYCDGWEHRGQVLLALGDGQAAYNLALMLRAWSPHVIACSNGQPLSRPRIRLLKRAQIAYRPERPVRLTGKGDRLTHVHFEQGEPLACDALFFSSPQAQRSHLPQSLGCQPNEKAHAATGRKQSTHCHGLFLAGDVDGDVQFAIVAAAEGAIAATAINHQLQQETIRTWQAPPTAAHADQPPSGL
jgi:thioredoxin reductase